jgi:hypothetical protein
MLAFKLVTREPNECVAIVGSPGESEASVLAECFGEESLGESGWQSSVPHKRVFWIAKDGLLV